MSTYESTLNTWLGEALQAHGLNAKPESAQGGGKRLDVEVSYEGITIALEAEQGYSTAKKASALKDADARLRDDLAECAVAICYQEGIGSSAELHASEILYALRTRKDRPAASKTIWTKSNLDHLVSVIRQIPQQLGDPDELAASLSFSLDRAVGRLSEQQKRDLAAALDLPAGQQIRIEFGNVQSSRFNQAAKRAMLVIATAVMFHAQLDRHRDKIPALVDNRVSPPRLYSGPWPPATASQCVQKEDTIGAFCDAWDLWLVVDYKPIFATARNAIWGYSQDPAFTAAVHRTAQGALEVARNIAGLRHDLLGRIFHRVLETARYDGSFYTTTAAATLLANLAIQEDMCDWSDASAIARLRITDPACGTGTLLMAAAERIRDLSNVARDDLVSRSLIERVLTGYDVNLTATHLAATTLGLLSPTTTFKEMKMFRALLGVENGAAYLGSLEFLSQDSLPHIMPWPTGVEQIEVQQEETKVEPADLVIMNPPFTRDSLRHDQFSREEELLLKLREKEIFHLLEGGIHRSHNGGGFLQLAEHIAKQDKGTVAVVLPLVGATNYSTRLMRIYLAKKFHIETIVTSHDPSRIYFSENTSIGEMLLICRRWPSEIAKPATTVVNLYENPATPAAAIGVAQFIVNDRRDDIKGTVQKWPSDRIAQGNWGAVQFLSPYLCESFVCLQSGNMFLSRGLGSYAKIGPAGQGVRGVFDRSYLPDESRMVALWYHKTDITQRMSAKVDSYVKPKPGKNKQATNLWANRGNLMLVTRARLNTIRCVCVNLSEKALGSLWVPVRFQPDIGDDETRQFVRGQFEKAICVYLNSTVGLLALLGDRTNKIPSYPHFSMDDLNRIPVPDLNGLDESQVSALAVAYDTLCNFTLLPLPQMEECETRKALDRAVVSALGISPEIVASIRRELTREPSITGKPYVDF